MIVGRSVLAVIAPLRSRCSVCLDVSSIIRVVRLIGRIRYLLQGHRGAEQNIKPSNAEATFKQGCKDFNHKIWAPNFQILSKTLILKHCMYTKWQSPRYYRSGSQLSGLYCITNHECLVHCLTKPIAALLMISLI